MARTAAYDRIADWYEREFLGGPGRVSLAVWWPLRR